MGLAYLILMILFFIILFWILEWDAHSVFLAICGGVFWPFTLVVLLITLGIIIFEKHRVLYPEDNK